MSTEQYVCSLCEDAFRETSENVNESINHLLFSPPKPAPHPAPCSPFYKASHHSLPQLKQSASDGCHLCTLLWAAAPSKVHSLYDEILRTDSHAQWLPCYITVDRAIFKTHQNPKRLLVEYKYQMALVDPKNYMQPLKRHFRLLWNEGILFSLVFEQCATLNFHCDKHFVALIEAIMYLFYIYFT